METLECTAIDLRGVDGRVQFGRGCDPHARKCDSLSNEIAVAARVEGNGK